MTNEEKPVNESPSQARGSAPQKDEDPQKKPVESTGNGEAEITVEIEPDEPKASPQDNAPSSREPAGAVREPEEQSRDAGESPVSQEINTEPLDALIVEEDNGMDEECFEILPEEVSGDAERIRELEEEVERRKNETRESFDRLVRLQAEFENFKKRVYKEKQEFKKYCLESILLEIIPSLDNLERGLQSLGDSQNVDSVVEGIKIIHRSLFNSLTKFGLKQIDSVGKTFNPAEHEAMMTVDSTEHDSNTIIEEFQKGYKLHDRVIRPSLVSVAKRVAAVVEEEAEPDEQITASLEEITSKIKAMSDKKKSAESENDNESEVTDGDNDK